MNQASLCLDGSQIISSTVCDFLSYLSASQARSRQIPRTTPTFTGSQYGMAKHFDGVCGGPSTVWGQELYPGDCWSFFQVCTLHPNGSSIYCSYSGQDIYHQCVPPPWSAIVNCFGPGQGLHQSAMTRTFPFGQRHSPDVFSLPSSNRWANGARESMHGNVLALLCQCLSS